MLSASIRLRWCRASSPSARCKTFLGTQAPCQRTTVRMVEGHQCHRVAHAHRRLLLGKAFTATSPNGRFVEGAKAIDKQILSRIEVHGKNLFYFFGASSQTVVHIHFGMSGAFRTIPLPGPDPTETTRLSLTSEDMGLVAHLSAMTVQHGPLSFYHEKITKLGPDPLREDADKELLWAKVQTSKKPIGLILMDQSMMAGVGNIYRAEILFKAGVHPEQPGRTLSREAFDRCWFHSVVLLQRGFLSGSILTVDPEEATVLGKPWTRRYIYNQRTCGRCGSAVRTWDMAARTVYACETCQPLAAGTELGAGRAAAVAAATQARLFKSRCAPDDAGEVIPAKMTVAELRAKLLGLNLDTRGNKAALLARVEAALKWLATPGAQQQGTEAPAVAAISPITLPGAGGGAGGGVSEGGAVGKKRKAVGTPGPAVAARGREEPGVRGDGDDGDGSSADELDHAEALLSASLTGAASASSDLVGLPLVELKGRAQALRLPVSGTKAQLVARLAAHAAAPRAGPSAALSSPSAASSQTGLRGQAAAATDPSVFLNVRPGIRWLLEGDTEMASAKDAALEKVAAGETRAVEHVALHDQDEQRALTQVAGAPASTSALTPSPSAKRPRRPSSRTASAGLSTPVKRRRAGSAAGASPSHPRPVDEASPPPQQQQQPDTTPVAGRLAGTVKEASRAPRARSGPGSRGVRGSSNESLAETDVPGDQAVIAIHQPGLPPGSLDQGSATKAGRRRKHSAT